MVPRVGRDAVVRLLHEGHPGVCRIKALARVWCGVVARVRLSTGE